MRVPAHELPSKSSTVDILVKRGSLVYVHLWVLEGAIRKWVPGMGGIFYVARDGLLVCTLLLAGCLAAPKRRAPWFWGWISVISCVATMQCLTRIVSLPVMAVGIRSYVAPFLLFYLVSTRCSAEITDGISRTILAYAPVEAVVTAVQVVSQPTAFVNRQVGTDATTSLINSGIVRATGTFSAPAGLALYVPLALAIGLASIASRRRVKMPPMLYVLTLILTAVLSGSRTALLAVGVVVVAFVVQLLVTKSPRRGRNFVVFGGTVLVTYIGVRYAFPQVLEAFAARFQAASQSESFFGRIYFQTLGFMDVRMSILGDAVGAHSQAGIAAGSRESWTEVDSIRWVQELGLVGLFAAFARLVLAVVLVQRALTGARRIGKSSTLVAWSLIPVLLFGQISQFPTAQGMFSIALCLLFMPMPGRHPSKLESSQRSESPALSASRSHLVEDDLGRSWGSGGSQ